MSRNDLGFNSYIQCQNDHFRTNTNTFAPTDINTEHTHAHIHIHIHTHTHTHTHKQTNKQTNKQSETNKHEMIEFGYLLFSGISYQFSTA